MPRRIPSIDRFRLFFAGCAEQIDDAVRPSRWAFVACALVLAGLAAHVTYFLWRLPERYPDLIVGELAWGATQKTRDYLLLFAFVFAFFIALGVIARVAAALTRRVPTYDEALHAALIAALVPAAMWFFGLLLTRNDSLALLYLSFALVASSVGIAATLARRPHGFWLDFENGRFSALLLKGMIVLCLAAVSGAALALALSRMDILYEFGTWASDRRASWSIILATALTGCAAVGVYMARSASAVGLENQLSRLLIAGQLLVPLLFCVLLPTPLITEGRRAFPYPVSAAAWITIGTLMLIAYADLYRCARSRRLRPCATSAALSPMCLIAIILFVKVMPAGTGAVSADDYHFGEFLIPWWSWLQHGMTPFWDYAPARGLVNYLPGALNALVFDGTAATMDAVSGYRSTLILLLAFPPLAYAIGKGPAFLGLVMNPIANGLSEIDVLATAALCVFCELFLRSRPVSALAAWIVLGTALVLIAPGQGGLFVLATSPLGLVLLRRAWLDERRRRLLALAAVSFAPIAVVLFFTPVGLMLVGAVRYGLEHSGVNTIANGIAWATRFASKEGPNPWLWEIGRVSWIATTLFAGVLVIRAAKLEPASRERLLVYAVPVFLLTLLFIVRAAGRLDVNLSRAGIASVWSLSLLLPLLLFAALRPRNRAVPTLIFVSAAATVAPVFGFAPSLSLLARSAETVQRQADRVPALDPRLPNLGAAWVQPEHFARLVAVRTDLHRLLEPGETYLDLTNRNAHYFYFDRPPPVESGAFYNLYHRAAQVRAIASLERDPPPAVLVEADNLLHDSVRASLRAHLLYRYVLFNYVPATNDNLIWMVRPDRLHRLGLAPRSEEHPTEHDLATLDRVFRSENLQRLPIAWGRAYEALSSQMRAVARISPERIAMAARDGGAPTEPDGAQQIVYDVTALDLAGRDAGLLSFVLECRGLEIPLDFRLAWATRSAPQFDASRSVRFKAVSGRAIVPVDAEPRWLLANQITKLRLAVESRPPCPALTIADTTLFQRTSADTLTQR